MESNNNDTGVDTRRREVLRLMALTGIVLVPGGLLSACGDGSMPMMGDSGSGPMNSDGGMMDPQSMADMPTIHQLLANHRKIRRTVEDIDGGIRAVTTSTDTEVASLIKSHVAAMRARLADGRPIRQGDPLFREIFKHHAAISITIEETADGVDVTETSADPQVVLLIRAHAKAAVSQFVDQGMGRAMQPTPLPDGYTG